MEKGKKRQVRTAAKGKVNSGKGREFRIERWANVIPVPNLGDYLCMFASRAEADDHPHLKRIACIRVLIQGREGDGLKKGPAK
jgi:hypothetical protein